MSTFATNHVSSLLTFSHPTVAGEDSYALTSQEAVQNYEVDDELLSLFSRFKDPFDKSSLRQALEKLNERKTKISIQKSTQVEPTLLSNLERRIIVGIYAEVLDQWLKEASDADTEAEWWDSVIRSSRSVSWYLLATLPERVRRSCDTILSAIHDRNLPLRPSSFTPTSIRRLFPDSGTLRPTALGTSFFPHLLHQANPIFTSPVALARQECELRYAKLVELRDERAEHLGVLLSLKSDLEYSMIGEDIAAAADRLYRGITESSDISSLEISGDATSLLYDLVFVQLRQHSSTHSSIFSSLKRPSRLTLIWPRLVLVPPITILLFRYIYKSRESIWESALSAHDTVKGFWFGYVVDPVRGILDTVRTGGDEGSRIVNPEAVRADLESLERMALDLAKDKLSPDESQLREFSSRIHQGDLTPVLRIYEQDIKTPVRTVVTGSLIRSLLIQIQKAKVDLDQALSGIDKLLKSQELTFAFVGVAPAFAIVYAFLNGAQSLLFGTRGKKRFGGQAEREGAWLAIRRIERLLITAPNDTQVKGSTTSVGIRSTIGVPLPPLTSGLMLIALARLRSYAETHLPPRSLFRNEMLSDIADLESPVLGRTEKLHIVERMWRSWGPLLGWDKTGKL